MWIYLHGSFMLKHCVAVLPRFSRSEIAKDVGNMHRLKWQPTNHVGRMNPRKRQDSKTTPVNSTSFCGPPKSSVPVGGGPVQFAMIEFSNINSSPSVITSDSGFDPFDEKRTAPNPEISKVVPKKTQF